MHHQILSTVATLGALVLPLTAATPARADDPLPGRMPGLRLPPRLRKPQGKVSVGSWVEFSLHDRTKHRRIRMHWALVGKTGRAYWWELSLREARRPVMRIKILIQGTVTKPTRIKRVIIQHGTSQALELPLKTGQKIMNVYLRRRRGSKIKNHGTARITVAAGTFDTHHYSWLDESGQTIHEWTSRKAGIWSLVRFQSSRFRMELIGQGRGARTRIRGIPAKWHIPGR
jgi:hypothetical protein